MAENNSQEDIEAVATCLQASKEEGLQAEVILFALYAMKSTPENTVFEALDAGMMEWIK